MNLNSIQDLREGHSILALIRKWLTQDLFLDRKMPDMTRKRVPGFNVNSPEASEVLPVLFGAHVAYRNVSALGLEPYKPMVVRGTTVLPLVAVPKVNDIKLGNDDVFHEQSEPLVKMIGCNVRVVPEIFRSNSHLVPTLGLTLYIIIGHMFMERVPMKVCRAESYHGACKMIGTRLYWQLKTRKTTRLQKRRKKGNAKSAISHL